MFTNYLQSKCRKFKDKTNNDEENMIRFYGPPSSCKELGKLGYTLNGYYLVENNENGKIKKEEGGEIELIFCRFQLATGTKGKTNNQITQSAISNKNNVSISIILYSENGGTSRISQDCQQIKSKKYIV